MEMNVTRIRLNWWTLALRGVAGLLLGIAAFVYTPITLTVIVLLFAAYLFVDGVFNLIAGFRARSWWFGLMGVLGIVAGLIAWRWPNITAVVLVVLTVVWAILTGAIEIGLALAWRRILRGEGWIILGGAISILFGIVLGMMLPVNPAAALMTIVYLIGAYALLAGIFYLVMAFRLRNVRAEAFIATT